MLILSALFTIQLAFADIPQAQKIRAWRDIQDAVTLPLDLNKYPEQKLICGQTLFPSHPQQSLKYYHFYQWGEYDQAQLKGEDEACSLGSHGYCLRAAVAYRVILSDVFEDQCGHLYRGFVKVDFLDKYESMGTLFSPGRAMYPKARGEFPNELEVGPTYAVPQKDFIKLGPALASDAARVIELKRATSLKQDPQTHLFRQP